jgi:hypothetical protein
MVASIIKLRYQGKCRTCGSTIEKSAEAEWNRDEKSVTCLACVALRNGALDGTPPGVTIPQGPMPQEGAQMTQATPPAIEVGVAGGAARREFERRQAKREKAIEDKFKRLAPVVKFLSDDPQSTRAWKRGAEGEEELGAALVRRLGDRAIVLHDRRIPRSRANIDHLVIAPSGVWVIDAKRYDGRLEQRTVGMFSSRRNELYVAGRNKTALADGVNKQVELVRTQLANPEINVRGVLCFIRAEWDFFAQPFEVRGILVTYGKSLAKTVLATNHLDESSVHALARELSNKFPPYER